MSEVRDIVMRFGFNATAYQILNPGIKHWVMPGGDAVLGFVPCGSTWVVAGAPVCAAEVLPDAVEAFEQTARLAGARVCYVCAADRMRNLLAGRKDHTIIAIGAQPIWRPADWVGTVATHAGMRAQIHRAQNKGIGVFRWTDLGRGRRAALEDILEAWLKARPMPKLGFLTGVTALKAGLGERLLFVAERQGEAVAYLVASPIPMRQGWLVEQIIRHPAAPNGTAELLINAAIRFMDEQGSTFVTLGLVPLAGNANAAMRANPRWVRLVLGWVRAHGRRFYHFEGLEAFREKLSPAAWEPIYAISNERQFSVGTLGAIMNALSEGRPVEVMAKALGQAVKREVEWVTKKCLG